MCFRPLITIIIITSLSTIFSCSFLENEILPDSPKELLKEGIKALKLDQTLRGRELLSQLIEDFPDSKARTHALLLLARSYYSYEEYEEAKVKFQKFIQLYPRHKNIDRAYFFKAMSDFKRVDLAKRDQTSTKEARKGFQDLIDQFPKSQYVEQAKQKKDVCDFQLAKHVLEVGKFYFRTGAYLSAISRFKSLMTDHPKQKFFDEAAFLLAESHYHEQSLKKAFLLYKNFLSDYPRSPFSLEAKKRLISLRKKN
ncbi:MAG: outer membrane protein assembly factor BamD [Nitrospina sp.]|nr:outer membrane protein assembly factor BamD [Nitrospina sp.]